MLRSKPLQIARFVEPGDFCADITSAWMRDVSSDDLVAMPDVAGIAITDSVFWREYLEGGGLGTCLRLKMVDAHLFAKELMCAKTFGRTETGHKFLEQNHMDVIGSEPQKDIAWFLGGTPQGLSRSLRRRKSETGYQRFIAENVSPLMLRASHPFGSII